MSSEDYLSGIRKAQTIQGNGGDPNLTFGKNPFEQAGIDAVKQNYNKGSSSDRVTFIGKEIDEYQNLEEKDKVVVKVICVIGGIFLLLLLSAL